LAEYVEEVLEQYDISHKLFCITTDGASNNKTMIASLSASLRSKHPDVNIDPKAQRVPCLAHIINLAVGAFLQNLKVLDASAQKDDK
jgi:hypothetical protein